MINPFHSIPFLENIKNTFQTETGNMNKSMQPTKEKEKEPTTTNPAAFLTKTPENKTDPEKVI